MNISIGQYVYSALSNVSGLTVYPVVADFDEVAPTTPFGVYQRTSTNPEYTKSLWTGSTAHYYTVTIADNDYTNSISVAQSAIDSIMALSHTAHDDIRFNQVLLTDLSEDFQNGLFIQVIQFEINTTQL